MKKKIKKILHKILDPIIYEFLKSDKDYLFVKQTAKRSINFPDSITVQHSSQISESTKLYAPFRIVECSIGSYTYIAQNSVISKTEIGKFCSIGPNFLCGWGIHPTNGISSSPMFYSTMKQNGVTLSSTNKIEERKPIKIGNDVFIGANVTVLDGVTIGDGAVIGAGAVVSKDIPPYAIAVGCPIRIMKYRFDEKQIESLLKIRWWEFPEEKLQEVEQNFFAVDEFIKLNSID